MASAAASGTHECDIITSYYCVFPRKAPGSFRRVRSSKKVMNSMDKRFFFDKYGLTEPNIERYLGAALSAGADYADLYFEYLTSTSISVDESLVKSATQGVSAGCGIRVIS